MADDYPHIQVTMLGGSGTGKTTYLLGMYAELSAGIDNYFLGAGHDTDLDLTSAWGALIEDGILPVGTDEGKRYEFMFRYGFEPLLALDWLDYRGGAMRDRSDSPGAGELLARLGASDSLYLTLDGALLAEVLDGSKQAERRLRDVVGRYTAILGRVVDERRENGLIAPSFVVLITKGDLLAGRFDRGSQEMKEWAVDLFGHVFRPDWDSAVCVVTLGDLGRPTDSRVEPGRIDPRRLHKPMVFSLYSFYRRAGVAFRAEAANARGERAQGQSRLNEARARATARFLGRKETREMSQKLQQLDQYIEMMDRMASECEHRMRVLEGELLDVATYIEGRWMDGSL